MYQTLEAIDAHVLQALYAAREAGLVQAFIGISEFGSTITIGGLALCVGLLLLALRQYAYFAGLCVSVIGTVLVVFPMKEFVARARPDAFYRAYMELGYAFPSGHASFSIALYGFLIYLSWKFFPRVYAVLSTAVGALLILLVGFSRLYLGLHYLDDVIGGYLIGGLMLYAGIKVAKRFSSPRSS